MTTQNTGEATAAAKDGRRERSERSRHKIAEAMIELIMAGDFFPSAEAVAEKAGVGLRTVFRHYKDMDNLFLEVSQIMRARLHPRFALKHNHADWREQMNEIVSTRASGFEHVMPMQQSTYSQRYRSKFVKGEIERTNEMLRTMLIETLPSEIRRSKTKLEALDATLSPAMWMRLRTDQNLDPKSAEKVLKALVEAIIA